MCIFNEYLCTYYSNAMYQGHSQQDSHEVFRTILDCIKNEECEVSVSINQLHCIPFNTNFSKIIF